MKGKLFKNKYAGIFGILIWLIGGAACGTGKANSLDYSNLVGPVESITVYEQVNTGADSTEKILFRNQYDEKGFITESTYYSKDKIRSIYRYSFDKDLILSISRFDEKQNLIEQYVHEYDGNRSLTGIKIYEGKKLVSKGKCEVSGNHKVLTVKSEKDGTVIRRMIYDKNDEIISTSHYREGKISFRSESTYESGKLSHNKDFFYRDGKLFSENRVKFISGIPIVLMELFHTDNNEISETRYRVDKKHQDKYGNWRELLLYRQDNGKEKFERKFRSKISYY